MVEKKVSQGDLFEELKLSTRSPLRYPGGKTRAVEIISNYFPRNLNEIVSPFFGGGSVELFLTAREIRVFGYDIFNPLVEFWQCLLLTPEQLANKVHEFYPLSREEFYELQQTQTQFSSRLERAAVYYVLNRASFSGATLSGGMSPDHPRFTHSSIDRLRKFKNPLIQVHASHFKNALSKHPSLFAYLDPPYLIQSSLYGKKGDAHKDFNHEELAEILKKRKKWILSYNDCDEIHELYKGFEIIFPNWKYGMSNNKSSKEVLIFSADLHAEKNKILSS